MFDNLAKQFNAAMFSLSRGHLHCLPYSRGLLDFCEKRGLPGRPLVVRCIVFNPQATGHAGSILNLQLLCEQVLRAPNANGSIVRSTTDVTRAPVYHHGVPNQVPGRMVLPYRTLGFPTNKPGGPPMGDYDPKVGWLGHLGIVVEGTMIDLTIGQMNSEEYRIKFTEDYLTASPTADFLSGSAWLFVKKDGMLICYRAFPDETTYTQAESWRDTPLRLKLKNVANAVVRQFSGKPNTTFHEGGE